MTNAPCLAENPLKTPQLNPAYLPNQPLFDAGDGLGWQLANKPFLLDNAVSQTFEKLGSILYQWQQASQTLYNDSLKGKQPAWIAQLLNQGKPDDILRFAQMNRFKKHVPLVLRPDVLLTDDGLQITELDWVPGGIGFISAMNHAYRKSGFPVQETAQTIPLAFLELLKNQVPDVENPVIAVVVAADFMDFWLETDWLVKQIQAHYPHIYLVDPKTIDWSKDRLVFTTDNGEEKPIDLVYRMFEHYDLPNIPKIELLQYAVKKGAIHLTSPFKPVFEEKLWMALLHHPVLANDWAALMGQADFEWLRALVPQSWILDPTPLPPQAIIPNLTLDGRPTQSFEALKGLSQKERQKVLKISGYSPQGWGSKSVVVGHDVSVEAWDAAVDHALASFAKNPYILQTYHKPKAIDVERFDPTTQTSQPFKGRVRLCPYYFVMDNHGDRSTQPTIDWVGTLATICPADKKIIHGMKDAIMAPSQVG